MLFIHLENLDREHTHTPPRYTVQALAVCPGTVFVVHAKQHKLSLAKRNKKLNPGFYVIRETDSFWFTGVFGWLLESDVAAILEVRLFRSIYKKRSCPRVVVTRET